MAKIQYVTEEGLKKMRDELNQLEAIERPKISRQIAEARDKGDLSENAEYDAAKEAQGLLEMRIAKLKDQISVSRVIDPSMLDHSKVSIFSQVKIKNTASGAVMTYTLVPETEADLSRAKISVNTPIAKGLLGRAANEIVDVELPNGKTLQFEIMEIKVG